MVVPCMPGADRTHTCLCTTRQCFADGGSTSCGNTSRSPSTRPPAVLVVLADGAGRTPAAGGGKRVTP
eukprot:2984384-Prymnesium_polylepis.1